MFLPANKCSAFSDLLRTFSASFTPVLVHSKRTWAETTAVISAAPIHPRTAVRLAAGVLFGAIATLAIVNNQHTALQTEETAVMGNEVVVRNETVAYRLLPVRAHVEDEGEPTADEAENEASPGYPRAVQTIKFLNPGQAKPATKVGGFVAFSGNRDTEQVDTEWSVARRKAEPTMVEVDQYLWEVYQRTPVKKDHSGEFTWKDPAAAKRMGMSVPDYVIGGMEPDFREQLYHAGQAMDAAGIQWSMLSGFRDDYRQKLASGFKARVGNSLHGGSRATGGYGHGRAIDITNADGDADIVWKWIDAHGAKFGLHRPIPGPDPAHMQSRGDWHKLAQSLRAGRLRAVADAEREAPAAKAKVAKAGL